MTLPDPSAVAASGVGPKALLVVAEIGTPAGDAADNDSSTFFFSETNAPRPLVQRDGAAIVQGQVGALYGTLDGMTIYDQDFDVASLGYLGFGGPKTPIGADLAAVMGWPNIEIAPGYVAIDPLLGRFKFHGGAPAARIGRWDPASGNAHDGVAVQGSYAYLTDWLRGLDIVDVSDPAHPVFQSNLALNGNGMDVVVDGGFAYVTMKSGGLRIVDVHNPLAPVEIASIKADPIRDDLALHLHKVGHLVFVADEEHGVPIYDVADPYHPTKIGACAIGFGESVWVEGAYAYLTGGNVGFHIYDISDPTKPSFKTSLPKMSYTYDVQVYGHYAYVAEGLAGLRVIDIADPLHPVDVALAPTAGEAYDVQIAHGFAYVAERLTPGHIEIFDLSQPEDPVLVKTYESAQRVNGLFPVGSLVYAAGHSLGLLVIQPNVSEAPRGPVTVDYNWGDPAATPTPTLTPQPTPTADPSRPVTLTLQVAFQGRGAAPSSDWQLPITVAIDLADSGAAVFSASRMSDDQGQVSFVDVAQGHYDIQVGKIASLSNVRHAYALRDDLVLGMGTFAEGDCNGDERINILDFSILATSFGVRQGEAGFDPRADLNGDSVINIIDFSLLAANYDMIGPQEITGP